MGRPRLRVGRPMCGRFAVWHPRVMVGFRLVFSSFIFNLRSITLRFVYIVLLCGLLVSCSTKQNTATTRRWQAFVTRYNVYHNAKEAYKSGERAQRNGMRENYTEPLPVYTVGYEKMRSLGKNDFQTAITKCEKAIQLHSIRKRPVVSANKRRSPRLKAYLSRKEFNPFLKNAWLLMGKAQFQQGDFPAAASTFAYITRFYAAEPSVADEARVWLARCYAELEWFYDAEDALRRTEHSVLSPSLAHERNLTTAGLLLRSGRVEEALPHLRRAASGERNGFRRARLYYLLAQTLLSTGRKDEAYRALKRCLAQNPSYEMAFHARILQTEALTTPKSAHAMIRRLKRMSRDDNNKAYLDQVFYAIGNIHLTLRDTAAAIKAYETGRYRAMQATPGKGLLLLRLGGLYWDLQRFDKAQPCFTEAIGLLDKDRPDHASLVHRSKILDQLVEHTTVVFEQDSLLALAAMPEADRNRIVDLAIAEHKRKEAEARKNKADSLARAMENDDDNAQADNRPEAPATRRPDDGDRSWYFYNPRLVQQGRQSFARQWGRRKNEDDWRRSNRTVVASADNEGYDYAADDSLRALIDARRDSLTTAGLGVAEVDKQLETYRNLLLGLSPEDADTAIAPDSLKEKEPENDPSRREYYLSRLPFTPEAQAEAHRLIQDGLFNAGIIEKDRLEDLGLADKTLNRLIREYPSYEHLDEAYYHLFLLAKRLQHHDRAEHYRQILATYYPEYPMTSVVNDPDFEYKSRYSRELEDSLYSSTYNAYVGGDALVVARNFAESSRSYPHGANRPKFILVHALSRLGTAPSDTIARELRDLATAYPKSDVAEMAGMIVRGLESGRTVRGGSPVLGSLWSRRLSEAAAESAASGQERRFKADKEGRFVFLAAYPTDSLSDDRLLYALARFNFSSFLSRGFDIAKEHTGGLTRFTVSGFLSFDDVHGYTQLLFRDGELGRMLRHARVELISEQNLKLLGTLYSFDEYRAFYDEHYSSLIINPDLPLDFEPVDDEPRQIYEDELPENRPARPQDKDEELYEDTPRKDTYEDYDDQ